MALSILSNYEKKLLRAIKNDEPIGPKIVMISPTDSCNIKCKICWRLEKKEDPNTWKDQELSLDEIKAILDDCKEMGVETVDFTGGGEPFCRKEIWDIIKIIKNYGIKGTLTSNGTLINEKTAKKIVELGLDDVCFSLDSFEEKINDEIRGKGVHAKVLKAIDLINKAKKDAGSDLPVVRLGTVITAKNYDKLESLVDFAANNNIKSINFSVLLDWESNKEFSMKDVKKQDVEKALSNLKKKLDKTGIFSNLNSIIKQGLSEHDTPNFCFAPWQMAFINSRGEMLACCILASFYENVIGNVHDSSFKELWQSKKMQDFRKRIKGKKWFKGCKMCLPQFVDDFNELNKKLGL